MRRVLVVRLDNVGDVVMTGPSLRALKAAAPAASITLLASPAGGSVAPLLREVDDVIVHRATWQDASGRLALDPGRELGLVEVLAARDFDAAVILTSFSQSPWPPAFVCYLAGIPVRVGMATDFGGSLLTTAAPPSADGTHQVDRNLAVVKALGVAPVGRHLHLDVPDEAAVTADMLLAEIGLSPEQAFVLVAPGASCPTRRYDPGRFAEVACSITREAGLPVVVVGALAEAPAAAPSIAAGARSLVGRTDVVQLSAVIRRASVLVANNSGPMHLADGLGTPQVVCFAGTEDEAEFAPRTTRAHLLRRPTSCEPCRLFECPYAHECLDVAPADVAAAALALLAAS